ncbi:MAG: glycosyltransferase [Kouleothrix sp.]
MSPSDGSNDGTNEIVQGYADQNVRSLALPRQGKAPALDAGVAASRGEIGYSPTRIACIIRKHCGHWLALSPTLMLAALQATVVYTSKKR